MPTTKQLQGDIHLNSPKALSPEAAAGLSHHKGSLSLRGWDAVSNQTAAVLARHEGTLNLDGLKSLSAEALSSLAQVPDKWLSLVYTFSEKLHAARHSLKQSTRDRLCHPTT